MAVGTGNASSLEREVFRPEEGSAFKLLLLLCLRNAATSCSPPPPLFQAERKVIMSQVDLYRRIREAMPHDAEVVELCDKYIRRYEDRSSVTNMNVEYVKNAMRRMRSIDDRILFTSKNIAQEVSKEANETWNVRKAANYLSRLVREGYLTKLPPEKGMPTMYDYAEN